MKASRLFLLTVIGVSCCLLSACDKDKAEIIAESPNMVISSFTIHGAGGSSIFITGKGFSSTLLDNKVTINGKAASITAATSTTLAVIVPFNAGTGPISVTVNNETATSADNFTYDWLGRVATFASGANLNLPQGAALDATGNLYVGEYGGHRIIKITPEGVASTFAGSGVPGSANGTGTAAEFKRPVGIATDPAGNLYVAELDGHRIRKITPAGVVTTFAGSGVAGSADGTGTAAQFNQPFNLTIDAGGNLYVADFGNNKIRKITPAGVVSTLAGSGAAGSADGSGIVAQFNSPTDLAADAVGNIYVADFGNNKIRKVTPAGTVTTFAGTGVSGHMDGTIAQFLSPTGIGLDSKGNLYITEAPGFKIRMITPAGIVSTVAGSKQGYVDDIGAAAQFNFMYDVVPDNKGSLYIPDWGNNKIRRVTLQ